MTACKTRNDIKRGLITLLSFLAYAVGLFVSNVVVSIIGVALKAPLIFFIISLVLGSACVWGIHILYIKKKEKIYVCAGAFCNILLLPVILVFLNFLVNPLTKLFGVYEQFDLGAFLETVVIYAILLAETVISMIIALVKYFKSK